LRNAPQGDAKLKDQAAAGIALRFITGIAVAMIGAPAGAGSAALDQPIKRIELAPSVV
jgi:hypothetical protein